jgi:ubiquinone/menaquinone biosynthesis C-methylase UbiE
MELSNFLEPTRIPARTIDNVPSFVNEVSGEDKKWNVFYDRLAPFYSHSEKILGRIILGIDFEREWQAIVKNSCFKKGNSILEVSPGSGVYQRYLREEIGPSGTLVSLDLSMGMLRACKRLKSYPYSKPLLIHGNGSDLPFQDAAFDGVFHLGGINLFSEPERAVSEFARVVKKGGMVVIGDEGFSADFPDGIRKKILTRMNPGYLKGEPPPLPRSLKLKSHVVTFGGCGYLIIAVKI